MARKRLTQVFPFLLPIRKWQRKKLFYMKMYLDKNSYAREIRSERLPFTLYETSSLLINEDSGFKMIYQTNKVHNLKLAARTIDGVVIKPGETFSFWQLVGEADRHEKYKDGLNLVNGKIVGSYGGGLCQLSNMLYFMFLNSSLTILERHGHGKQFFSPQPDSIKGIDATINEGWLDLKVRNDGENTFQIEIDFDDMYMYGRLLSLDREDREYMVYNGEVSYERDEEGVYEIASVLRRNKRGWNMEEEELYVNRCQIAYELPDEATIEERRA